MGKRKRKLTAAEKAAKKQRRQEFTTVFINGKMKRIRRAPMVEGMSVDDFIRGNADPIFLHREEMWEYLEEAFPRRRTPVLTLSGREPVSYITTEEGDDLVVGLRDLDGRTW